MQLKLTTLINTQPNQAIDARTELIKLKDWNRESCVIEIKY